MDVQLADDGELNLLSAADGHLLPDMQQPISQAYKRHPDVVLLPAAANLNPASRWVRLKPSEPSYDQAGRAFYMRPDTGEESLDEPSEGVTDEATLPYEKFAQNYLRLTILQLNGPAQHAAIPSVGNQVQSPGRCRQCLGNAATDMCYIICRIMIAVVVFGVAGAIFGEDDGPGSGSSSGGGGQCCQPLAGPPTCTCPPGGINNDPTNPCGSPCVSNMQCCS